MNMRFVDFKRRIEQRVNSMDAKIVFMRHSLDGLRDELTAFKDEFDLH